MDLQQALEERKRLREVYNTIADCWSHLKSMPWPEVKEFSSSVDRGTVLDIGCNNGRNLLPFLEKKVKCIGFDFSRNMIREAKKFLKKKGFKTSLIIADVLDLPFREKAFDAIIFSRALHHIPTSPLRAETLRSVKRLLKPDGKILITVWCRYYPRFLQDYFSSLFERKFEFGDTYKKWTYEGNVYKRFFHLYSREEFEEELNNAGLKVKRLSKDDGSLIATCEQS
jgi:alkylated DNA repair protein alkB family protein 8